MSYSQLMYQLNLTNSTSYSLAVLLSSMYKCISYFSEILTVSATSLCMSYFVLIYLPVFITRISYYLATYLMFQLLLLNNVKYFFATPCIYLCCSNSLFCVNYFFCYIFRTLAYADPCLFRHIQVYLGTIKHFSGTTRHF